MGKTIRQQVTFRAKSHEAKDCLVHPESNTPEGETQSLTEFATQQEKENHSMPIRKLFLSIASTAAVLVLSCTMLTGLSDTSEEPQSQGSPRFADPHCGSPQADSGNTRKNTSWPGSVPSEIPPLEENISTVFNTGSMIRIFYSGTTVNQINDYLGLLEQHGFSLKPIVYVREGFPDKSVEKMSEGDYDAIEARKGTIFIRIEFGCDNMDMVIQTNQQPD